MPADNQLLNGQMVTDAVNAGTLAWLSGPTTKTDNQIWTWNDYKGWCKVTDATAFTGLYCPNYAQMKQYASLPGPSAAPYGLSASVNSTSGVVTFTWTNGDSTATTRFEANINSGGFVEFATAAAGATTLDASPNWVKGDGAQFQCRHYKNSQYSGYSNIVAKVW